MSLSSLRCMCRSVSDVIVPIESGKVAILLSRRISVSRMGIDAGNVSGSAVSLLPERSSVVSVRNCAQKGTRTQLKPSIRPNGEGGESRRMRIEPEGGGTHVAEGVADVEEAVVRERKDAQVTPLTTRTAQKR